ncbi:subunit IV of cytochrome c oxidase [Hyaloraphidium curvatum]|nr:subunit IV of cytochrome c oxidase [Hyaloraphidium curvatum]
MFAATLLRRSAAVVPRRAFSLSARALAGAPSSKNLALPLGDGHVEDVHGLSEPVYDSVPGFGEPGKIPTNYEIAVGMERFEMLQKLDGKVTFDHLVPIVAERKPTRKDPLVVRGVDHEAYIGCSGFPAESHEPVWLTLKDNGYVYRCPACGSAYKYEDITHHH